MTSKIPDSEEEECFYESFDRILSSASSSTSTSDDDDNCCINSTPIGHNQNHNQTILSSRLMSKYDIWTSVSLSVQERRSRLLREIGFSSDCSLAGRKPPNPSGRVALSDHILKNHNPSDGFSMVRSKSDGSSGQLPPRNHRKFCSASSPSILMVPSGEETVENASPVANNTSNEPSSSIEASPCKSPAFSNESDCNGGLPYQLCTIRDLDNGKEFVLNEFREDGMLNKLKEVGTGRQMTIEEFQKCVGHSPIVQELMRRQNVEGDGKGDAELNTSDGADRPIKSKKKSGWLRSIKNVATSMTGRRDMRSGDERDSSSEKGGRRSSSATDDSQEVSFHGPERVRVRQYGKSCKELSALFKTQEIHAHKGSIWSIKFSLDGRYLASAGEDCVIHIWQVMEMEKKGELVMEKRDDGNACISLIANGSPEATSVSPMADGHLGKKKKSVVAIGRKSPSLDHVVVPENIFAFSEKPICSFHGHLRDVLDLSWSKSQHLLSSSMDKTVRLWHLSKQSCLKVFSHNDYVTCIQFNPVDDRYFISGSLDAKVRIWSIPDRQVVDWCDLHEMVTAACYTSDGQGAFVGSYKGSCHLYNTFENKLQHKSQILLRHKKKRFQKKITGFQFASGSSSEAVITSADSRIRVVNGSDVVHKLKGFRNTNSQITATFTANGKHVVCASEDSNVYVWNYKPDSRPLSQPKPSTVTRSYEHFRCQGVTVAIPWPGKGDPSDFPEEPFQLGKASPSNHPPTPVEPGNDLDNLVGPIASPAHATMSSASNGYFFDRISATWPEEELAAPKSGSPRAGTDKSAWGLVIVTAGLQGEIRSFQNFGLPC